MHVAYFGTYTLTGCLGGGHYGVYLAIHIPRSNYRRGLRRCLYLPRDMYGGLLDNASSPKVAYPPRGRKETLAIGVPTGCSITCHFWLRTFAYVHEQLLSRPSAMRPASSTGDMTTFVPTRWIQASRRLDDVVAYWPKVVPV
jgi:hypothetical protein